MDKEIDDIIQRLTSIQIHNKKRKRGNDLWVGPGKVPRISSNKVIDMPELMSKTELEYYKEQGKIREGKLAEYNKYSDIVESLLRENLISILNTEKSTSWVGGGRSWNKSVKEFHPEVYEILGPLEKLSIQSGNWDIFQLTNMSLKKQQENACKILKVIDKFVSEFNSKTDTGKMLETRNVRGITSKKKGCLIEKQTLCTIFNCRSISLYIRDASIDKTSEGTLLMYIEIANVSGIDLEMFNEYFTFRPSEDGVKYLNPWGCLLFGKFIKKNRDEKGYNIDYYRVKIYKDIGIYNELLREAVSQYDAVFGNTTQYNSYLSPELKYELYNNKYAFGNLTDQIEINVMKNTRHIINSAIIDINNQLKDDAFLFIVGGDAIRRLVPSVDTKDIDTKLYFTGDINDVISVLIEKLSLLCTVLNESIHTIFDEKLRVVGEATVEFIYAPIQFTLRYIQTNGVVPPLFSVDYKYRVSHSDFVIKNTLPILDVILQKSNVKRDKITTYTQPRLYIANQDFLIQDLIKTYSDKAYANGRFWAKKNEKDIQRFIKLISVKNESGTDNLSTFSEEYFKIITNATIISKAKQYYTLFTNYMNENKAKEDKINPSLLTGVGGLSIKPKIESVAVEDTEVSPENYDVEYNNVLYSSTQRLRSRRNKLK